jgi:hypothetical protein
MMKKRKNEVAMRILKYCLIVIAAFVVLFSLHKMLLGEHKMVLSLNALYAFFVVSTLIIIVSLELLANVLPDKVGYAFLMAVFIKMGLFILIFSSNGLLEKKLYLADKLGVLLPFFIFLLIEALAIASRLKLMEPMQASSQERK